MEKLVRDILPSFLRPMADAIMIGILLVAFFHILWVEKQDSYCPKLDATEEECKMGDGGMAYSGSKPNKGDSDEVLKEKISIAAGAERKSIKWRRAFIIAVVASIFLWSLLLGQEGRIPPWTSVYLTMIIIFVVVYGNFSYYTFHIFSTPEKYINDSLEMMGGK